MSEKKVKYCGSGKKQNETWIKATINTAKIKDHIEEFNGNKFVRLNINIKPEKDHYGKDVSISIDQWKPDQQEQPTQEQEEDDGMPF